MIFNATPNGSDGAFWQSGGGLVADSSGLVYGVSGNGTFDSDSGGKDIGEACIKWSPTLEVLAWFDGRRQRV